MTAQQDREFWWDEGDDRELLRFGDARPHDLAKSAWVYASGRGAGSWGVSVWWWPDASPVEIADRAYREASQRGKNPFPHQHIRTVNRAALHDFEPSIEVRQTFTAGHYTLQLPGFYLERDFDQTYHEDPTSFHPYDSNAEFFDGLAAQFGPTMPNPVRHL